MRGASRTGRIFGPRGGFLVVLLTWFELMIVLGGFRLRVVFLPPRRVASALGSGKLLSSVVFGFDLG